MRYSTILCILSDDSTGAGAGAGAGALVLLGTVANYKRGNWLDNLGALIYFDPPPPPECTRGGASPSSQGELRRRWWRVNSLSEVHLQ